MPAYSPKRNHNSANCLLMLKKFASYLKEVSLSQLNVIVNSADNNLEFENPKNCRFYRCFRIFRTHWQKCCFNIKICPCLSP